MFKNYIKTAWRNLWFNKVSSLVSVVGLSLGITCFLLLATYLTNELRYDAFHVNTSRIVRIIMNTKGTSDAGYTAVTPTAPVPVFKNVFSEVEDGVRVYNYSGDGGAAVKYKDKLFSEKNVLLADESFFNIFSFKFLAVNPAKALVNPQSVVLTRSAAQKYFGNENPLGKLLVFNAKRDMVVTGVIEDVPAYSHIKFDMMGTYAMLDHSKTRAWDSANDFSYLLLKPHIKVKLVENKINTYLNHIFREKKSAGNQLWYKLEPLTDIHLRSPANFGLEAGGNITQVYILAVIAGILLLMACINFLNLATARSADRAHEIGVRKVMGAMKGQLFFQFMTEAAMVTFISIVIGVLAALLSFGWFSNFAGRSIGFYTWKPVWLGAVLTALFALVTLLAGTYPSVYLSSFKPISILGKKMSTGMLSINIRKSLVVVQFSVSVIFITCTLIAGKQLTYMQQKDTGLNRSQVVIINTGGMSYSELDAFNNQLSVLKGVDQVSASYDSPVNIGGGYNISNITGKPADYEVMTTAIPVERNFIPALGMHIIAGSNFTAADALQVQKQQNESREYSFVINETVAKSVGWAPADAIGKKMTLGGRKGEVRGVVKNFNFASLHETIGPVVIFPEYDWVGKVIIKVSGTNVNQTIKSIEHNWKSFYPDIPFEYHFLDQEFEALFINEQRTGKILTIFTCVTIIISCLGLFGLAVYTVKQRVKEIGVRKVLGASAGSVIALIASDFFKLVLGAFIIAVPVAWFVMNKWLHDFAYRTQISCWLFVQAAFYTIVITLITVAYQSVKAALANPVKSLRSE